MHQMVLSSVSLIVSAVAGMGLFADTSPLPVVPLPQAHAHNDYEHARPLLDALACGFCSVEADIWLTNGLLLVAHNLRDVRQERTLEALYLEPLRERAERNSGRVFPGGPSFTLLVDIKSESAPTYLALCDHLKAYAHALTVFRPEGVETNALTIILSGEHA